jgi:hypothetical protein
MRFGLANGLLASTVLATAVAGLQTGQTELLTVVVAGLASVGLSVAMTAWIATVAWALVTGFVENRYGELTFSQSDVGRLLVFAVATIALALLTRRLHSVIKENAHD